LHQTRSDRQREHDLRCRLAGEAEALRARVADLSMMVRRLVRALPTDHIIGGQAMMLLTRHHLEGSPLRATESAGESR
jgi:hypothetical protein